MKPNPPDKAPAPAPQRLLPQRESAELSSVGEAVAELIQLGLSLPDIAARRGLPSLDTLVRWMAKGGGLRKVYDQAAALRAEAMADSVVAIADRAAGDSLAGARLRIEARKWRAALFRKDAEFGPFADDERVAAEAERELREWQGRVAAERARQADQDRQRMARERAEREKAEKKRGDEEAE